MKNIILLVIFLVIIGAVGVFFLGGKNEVGEESSSVPVVSTGIEHTVVYGDDGYIPASISITSGDTVVFQNMSSSSVWPASNAHPTHTLYPDSSIQKCGGEDVIFDACGAMAPGQEWSFIFMEQGTWRYHNHMRPSMQGTIIVE